MGRVAPGPTQDTLYNLHKSLGVLILILMVLRLINRLAVGAPIADPRIESGRRPFRRSCTVLLYVFLVAMPIVGYIANSAFGAPTPFFGLFNLPPIVGKNEALSEQLFTIHRWTGWFLILLVLTHVRAALFHHFVRRDNVINRMLPRAMGGY